jgi:hypothetical protein
MKPVEDQIRAELARQAASLDFVPGEEAWRAIEERAANGHLSPGAAHRPPRGWLMVAGVAAAAVAAMLAGTLAGSLVGRSRPVTAASPAATQSTPATLPRGVVRIAPPAGEPGITLYAWGVTLKISTGPLPASSESQGQVSKLPTRNQVEVCVSDQPPTAPPSAVSGVPVCPISTFFEWRVDHTPNFGFPIAGGDAWVGAATAKVGAVEARYADGRVVRGSIVTVPGTTTRIWELGLPGPQRLGSPLPGVSLVLLDTRGRSLGQGTLSASLPYAFPFEMHGTVQRIFSFYGVLAMAALTFQGKYAVFGYAYPGDNQTMIQPAYHAYPLPASRPLQGEFGYEADFYHPWWYGLAQADVARVVVRLADGQTMQATCPSPAPAAPPGKGPGVTPLTAACAALPGAPGGARVFAIQLPQSLYRKAAIPQGTATAYNAAGQPLATVSLGANWHKA